MAARQSTAMGVSIRPGRMALARTPASAWRSASWRVKVTIAAFDAVYSTVGWPVQPTEAEEMLTIAPPPA